MLPIMISAAAVFGLGMLFGLLLGRELARADQAHQERPYYARAGRRFPVLDFALFIAAVAAGSAFCAQLFFGWVPRLP